MNIHRLRSRRSKENDRSGVESVGKKSDRELSISSRGCRRPVRPGRTTIDARWIETDFNSCREFHVRLALDNHDANAIEKSRPWIDP